MEKNAEFIRKKEFHIIFKGYKPDEVDKFLDILSVEFDRLIKKNREIQDSLDKLKFESTVEDTDIKKIIQDALISAHKVAEDIKNQAKKEAEEIIQQRKLEEEKTLSDLQMRKLQFEESIILLQSKYDELKNKIKKLTEDMSAFIEDTNTVDISTEADSFELQSGDETDITSESEPNTRHKAIFEKQITYKTIIHEKPAQEAEKNPGEESKEFSSFDRYKINSERDSGYYFERIQKQQEQEKTKETDQQKQEDLDKTDQQKQEDLDKTDQQKHQKVADNAEEQVEKETDFDETDTPKRERKKIDIANPDIIENFFKAADD
jgi:cell division initiation protein